MASGNIKGITIEIGGDTTKLSKALRGVDSEVKNTQTALRNVEKALKMDPGNMDLLKEKQKLLGDQINETKQKLNTLKEADSQAKKQLASGDIGVEDYRALQREITLTESKLKGLQKQESGFSPMKDKLKEVGQNVSAVGDKMTEVGSGMTKYVSGPIIAAGAASAAAFNEVDSAMDLIVTKTGASGDALTDMQNRAKNMAETIPTSFKTAATAVGDVATRFKLSGDDLQSLSTQFVEFADINKTDVTTSVEGTQQVLAAFGMSADQAGNMLGLFTSVSQQTGVSVDDLMSNLQANGATFRDMGLSAADATTLLGNFEAAGIDSDTAMTALKKAAVSFQSAGVDMSAGLQDLIGKLNDGEVSTADYNEAVSVFGKRGADAFVDMASSGRLSISGLSTDLSNYGSTVSDTFNGTLDPVDQTKTALNQLKDIGSEVFSTAQEMAVPVLQAISDKLKEVKAWWDNLAPAQQEMILKIAGIAAAAGPVLMIAGKILNLVGTIMIFPIPALIIAIIAGLVTLYATCEPFREFINSLFQAIKAIVLMQIEIIKQIIAVVIEVWNGIVSIVMQIPAFLSGIWAGIVAIFSGVADFFISVFTAAIEGIQAVWSGIVGFFSDLFQGAIDVIQSIWSGIIGFFSGVWDGIMGIFNSVGGFFSGIFQGASDIIQGVFGGITGFASDAWNGIQNAFSGVAGFFDDIFGHFKFPHIDLPHFSINGSFSLDPPSIPTIGIDWYANGAILKKPTVFGMNGNSPMVGGEAGPEAIAPISELKKYLGNSGTTYNIYIDGIKYNDGDMVDRRISDFVEMIAQRGRMING